MNRGNRSNDRICGADAVTGASGEGEGNGFIDLNCDVRRGINGQSRGTCTRSKSDGFSWSWGCAGVVVAVCCSGDAVVDGEGIGGSSGA